MAKIVASFLTEEQEFQRLQAEDARAVGRRHGLEIDVIFAHNNSIEQIQQLFKYIYLPEGQRPAAIVVETVAGEGLQRVARNAAKAGIGWVLLNRKVGYLQDLRREYPKLPIATVGTDQVEVGRIQGRQVGPSMPDGGGLIVRSGSDRHLDRAGALPRHARSDGHRPFRRQGARRSMDGSERGRRRSRRSCGSRAWKASGRRS